jgi:hypothetical protein
MTLLAAYNFDEVAGDILDLSGNGLDIPLSDPAVRATTGHTGKGLTQTGTGIFLAPAEYLTTLKTAQRTVMAWVKETSPVIGWVLELHSSSIASGSWGMLFLSSQWHIQARNSSGFVRASVARPTDSQFHHVAGTYDGVSVRLYLDGVLVSTQPLTEPLRNDADVFRFQDNSSPNVTIDDVRFFDEALDQATISSLMSTPVTAGRSGRPKVWNGSTWIPYPAKVWNGSAWVEAAMTGHDGTDWVKSK